MRPPRVERARPAEEPSDGLEALLQSLGVLRPPSMIVLQITADVLRNGPAPNDDLAALADLHRRGLEELEVWLRTATAPAVLALLP